MATIGGMATFKDRIGIIPASIESIYKQVDLLLIYCNDQESYDALIDLPENVKKHTGANITDRGKFFFCEWYEGDHEYYTFDDDLIYPVNYIERTSGWLNKYPKTVVSHHGKKLVKRGIKSYYAKLDAEQFKMDYRVLDAVDKLYPADILGTGCMAFRLDTFRPLGLKEDMMADIEISCQLEKLNIQRFVLPHPPGWVVYHPSMRGKWTTWDHFQKNSDSRQTELVNKTFT